MKKGIRIFLMIVVVVLVFAGVQWVPNIVNQMQEKKDLRMAEKISLMRCFFTTTRSRQN